MAGRQNAAPRSECADAVARALGLPARRCAHLAQQPLLSRSFDRLDVDRLHETADEKTLRAEIHRAASGPATGPATGPCRGSPAAHGRRRIVEEPPLITRVTDPRRTSSPPRSTSTSLTLAPHWRRVLAGYTLVDVAHKVVGVGSVGLRAYVALLEGSSPDDVCSCSSSRPAGRCWRGSCTATLRWHAHQGQRVVEYQQALQTVSDPLLGWTCVGGRQYYVRQFRDMKGAITFDGIDATALADYAGICGHLLAKGHARTSGASMIAGYVGTLGEPRPRRWPASPATTPIRSERDHDRSSTPSRGAACRPSGGVSAA